MLRAIVVLATLTFVACDDAPSSEVDAGPSPDAPVGRDGGDDRPDAAAGGLTFHFSAGLPNVAASVTIDEARIWLRDIRAIGDSAPGDSRTSLDEAELDARSDREPESIGFALAPPGIYSRIDMRLGQPSGGSGRQGYELRGSVVIAAQSVELEISDPDASDAISVALGSIAVDNETDVTIRIDLSFLGGIDWSTAPRDGDKISLDGSDALTATVRAGIVAAFRLP